MALERVELRVDAFAEAAERDAVLMSDSAVVAQWFSEAKFEYRSEKAKAEVESLFRKVMASEPLYREVRLLNRDGSEVIRIAHEGLSSGSVTDAHSAWFDDVGLNWGASIHRSVIPHADDGQPSLTVARPVRPALGHGTSKRPTLEGYVVISVSVNDLGQTAASKAIGHNGFFTIVDEDGSSVHVPEEIASEAQAAGATWFDEYANSKHSNELVDLDVDGVTYQAASTELFEGLNAVVLVPASQQLSVAVGILKIVALVTVSAVGVLALMFHWLVRRVIVNPLHRLQKNVDALGDGNVSASTELERDDEIGDLANSFDSMSEKLSESMSELRDSHERIRQSHKRIQSLAYEDGLTGLPNRRGFLEALNLSVQNAQYSDTHVAVMFLDLADFKRLNDVEGHRAGDRLLKVVAQRIDDTVDQHLTDAGHSKHELSSNSCVARIGSDEFVVLLDNVSSARQVEHLADAIFSSLADPIDVGESEQLVRASAGVALFPEHAVDPDDLIASADAAMYKAKHGKSYSWCMYDRSMKDELDERFKLERDLRGAFDGQLKLQYQPQFRVADKTLWGLEALIRWEHPERGLVTPADFISLAEETGLIVEIGDWVINEACRQWTEWCHDGVAPERIAVNVSQRQFALGDVEASVEAALQKFNMPPSALELEITESCIMDAAIDVVGTLKKLRRRGIHVAMDDFGTGHSSLGALTELPIDTLKVDRCFISGICEGDTNDTIVAAVLMLAERLNLTVIAEGVETELEFERLRWHGCDIGQGYLLACPMWRDDVTALLVAHNGDGAAQVQAA